MSGGLDMLKDIEQTRSIFTTIHILFGVCELGMKIHSSRNLYIYPMLTYYEFVRINDITGVHIFPDKLVYI